MGVTIVSLVEEEEVVMVEAIIMVEGEGITTSLTGGTDLP